MPGLIFALTVTAKVRIFRALHYKRTQYERMQYHRCQT
ncbi:MAG: hypothetical protein QOH78_708 [Verrucomicrobiota bacterium]|jgi:hypothetical protein